MWPVGIALMMLAWTLTTVSSAVAAPRLVSKQAFQGEISHQTARLEGSQALPRDASGYDPQRNRFFASRLILFREGQTVSFRMGSRQFVPQILVYGPSRQLLVDSDDLSSPSREADGSIWVSAQFTPTRNMHYTVVATTRNPGQQGIYALEYFVYIDDPASPPDPSGPSGLSGSSGPRGPSGTPGLSGAPGAADPQECRCPLGTSQSGGFGGQELQCRDATGRAVPPIPPGCYSH